jgi:acetoacetate decarboxylase
MNSKDIRRDAFAMPLTSPAFPRGTYWFSSRCCKSFRHFTTSRT